MQSLSKTAALLVLDAPTTASRGKPSIEDNTNRLLTHWRRARRPVFHIRHAGTARSRAGQSPSGEVGVERLRALPGERVIEVLNGDAFEDTGLAAALRDAGTDALVLTGRADPRALADIARVAGNLGFVAYVVADGSAAPRPVGSAGTQDSGAGTVTAGEVLRASVDPRLYQGCDI
ncbi:MAG: isochorismatase family protein [Alphaproteobacteria bacterium]|nr:isochorismatase family protein [Alphaproteobacteria bacterium]